MGSTEAQGADMLYSDEPDFQLADSLAVLRRDIPWDIYQVGSCKGM